jgi:hypothetical protein
MTCPTARCVAIEEICESFPKVVTPECFYRGSSRSFAWISAEGRIRQKLCGGPARSMRE